MLEVELQQLPPHRLVRTKVTRRHQYVIIATVITIRCVFWGLHSHSSMRHRYTIQVPQRRASKAADTNQHHVCSDSQATFIHTPQFVLCGQQQQQLDKFWQAANINSMVLSHAPASKTTAPYAFNLLQQ